MKWKIYRWFPEIKLGIYIVCLLFWGYMAFEEFKQNNLIFGLGPSTIFLCFLLPICMDQIDKLTKQKMTIVNDEREAYIRRKTGNNTLKSLKIICLVSILVLTFISYACSSVLLTGIILGLGGFTIVMYFVEMILYLYYQRIE